MKVLKKEVFNQFIDFLLKRFEVIAPVRKGHITVFDKITRPDRIDFSQNTYYPAKKYFLPSGECLLKFRNSTVHEHADHRKRVIIGMRKCDVNALLVLDRLFIDEQEDVYYRRRRENTYIIALDCTEPGHNCFCHSFNLKDEGYDLLLTPAKEYFLAQAKSREGHVLLKNSFFQEKDLGVSLKVTYKKEIDLNKSLDYDSPGWKSFSDKCLSCAACTIVCPTCGCFDMRDDIKLNLAEASRTRHWDSCQLKNFTKVAGGHVFRESRDARLKHFVLHKLKYYKEKFGVHLCVGCGRCITACPAKIDITEVVDKI